MRPWTLLGAMILLGGLQAHAQSSQAGFRDFLKAALEDPAYLSYDSQGSILRKPGAYALPWVPSLEFRTRNNELLDSRQQYALRADVGNPWQIHRNQQYFQGVRNAKSLEQQLLLKKLIRERYDLVLEYGLATERLSLAEKLRNLREQLTAVMAQRSGVADFDAEQYLNSVLEGISRQADVQEAAFERDLARTRMLQLNDGTDVEIDLSGFADIATLQDVVRNRGTAYAPVEVELLKQEITNSEQRMATDRLDFDLGFVQGMYAPYRAARGDGQFGIAAGVTIPLFNQNRDDIAREKLKVIERKGALEQFQRRENGRIQAEANMILLQISHYAQTDSLIHEVRKRQLNLPAALSKDYHPIVELKYQEKLLELEWLKLRIRREVLRQYIAFLDNSGKLSQRPLVNYLSRGLEPVE